MRALSLASLCIAALLTVATAPPASAQTIKIGVFGPLTGDAAAMRVRQDGGVKAPPQVPQSDRQHESARNRPRPGSSARPVQDKNQKERRDQQRWAQRF